MNENRPVLITSENSYCPGCGHGIFDRILAEVLEEMGLHEKAICAIDIACSYLTTQYFHTDYIMGPHGRISEVACGMKHARPENVVYARCGDGAAYAIGLAETMSVAIRNENICMFVVNNTIYGMTGGQMAPTTLPGQYSSSSIHGKDPQKFGNPVNVVDIMGKLPIAYLARGSVASVAEIHKLKAMIKKAITHQLNGDGFSFVEILSPCPTNWNMTPLQAIERMKEEVYPYFACGEFIDKEVAK